jgi:hypothetical protein
MVQRFTDYPCLDIGSNAGESIIDFQKQQGSIRSISIKAILLMGTSYFLQYMNILCYY